MNFQKTKKLAVVAFSKSTVSGILFRISKDALEPLTCVSETISEADPSIAWKNVLRQMGRGKDCPIYLCGALRGGICFDTQTAELAPRFQKQALELELPRHLLSVPENARVQFLPLKKIDDGMLSLRAYAVPEKSFEPIAAMLTQGSSRADEFIYPALALRQDDPPFYAPELEKDFYFANGTWHKMPLPADAMAQWEKKIRETLNLQMAENFSISGNLLHILIARLLLEGEKLQGLTVLPTSLRPKRLQNQLRITALLLSLLILNLLWSCGGEWKRNFTTARSIQTEINVLQAENAELKRKLKSKEKSQKELLRILTLKVGENELPGKLADLSAVIPAEALVISLRWNESGVELQMQCPGENVNIAGALRTLPYWKISQLQQRSWGDAENTMVTLKLIPAEEDGK